MVNSGIIELRCKKCNKHFMDYIIQNDDETIVMQAINIKCDRCKNILMLKRYTEGFLLSHSKKGTFKI